MSLWRACFYRIFECFGMKNILEYDDNISIVCHWAQGIVWYHFNIIHGSKRMMLDVDTISCRFGPLISQHIHISTILLIDDRVHWYVAYSLIICINMKVTAFLPFHASNITLISELTTYCLIAQGLTPTDDVSRRLCVNTVVLFICLDFSAFRLTIYLHTSTSLWLAGEK